MLDISENNLGDSGIQLAQNIRSWGDDAKLKGLYMAKCSMPVAVWSEVLQSLSACKNLNEFVAPKEVLDEAENFPEFITLPSHNLPVADSSLENESSMVIQHNTDIFLTLIQIFDES